ncbi:MAG: hydroxyphenylacetyl-CoA thioesterase PaaI [Nitrososphaerales archaeon]|nr:hydroxyphenylacetyl-CoA thioesterase PaaI [Nitrososphaerales archaeon]
MVPELDKIRGKIDDDRFTKFMGIQLLELREGYSKLAMTITDEMLNFHNMAHGGAIFALADAAFAAASNSHGQIALALCMNINYRSPANKGMKLVAECLEESLGRRTALYRIEVRSEDGRLIASSQGTVYRKEEELANV